MIISRISACAALLSAALLTGPAVAQTEPGGRDASFLPPAGGAPAEEMHDADAIINEAIGGETPAVITPPEAPAETLSAPPPQTFQPPPDNPAPPPPPPSVAPSVTSAPAPAVINPPPSFPPVMLGKPVESGGVLKNIDSESVGLLSSGAGGLGAAMWNGTPRGLVERLLPALSLPGFSPALNNLAQRFLTTVADVPEGETDAAGAEDKKKGGRSLVAMRVEKLVMLGNAADAWKLAMLAKPEQIDEITLRLAAEAALTGGAGEEVCAKMPEIVRTHNSAEWQKSLIVCQLLAKDDKAARLGLDVLHTQGDEDTTFFALAERNVIGGNKTLPRQLTPLKPVNLALLQLTGLPLPPEVYARPDAALIPQLLRTKARDDNARLALASRAAARGLITASQLADVYRGIAFAPPALENAVGSSEKRPRLQALLYQAAFLESAPGKRLDAAIRFVNDSDAAELNGAAGKVAAEMIADIPATAAHAAYAAQAARIFIVAGKPDAALGWLKLAQQAAGGAPEIGAQLLGLWPLTALTGLESDGNFSRSFNLWLAASLTGADRARREETGNLLLLLDAAGFAVPDDAWALTADAPAGGVRILPPPVFLIERLQAAATANRRGEAVLLGLMVANANADQPSLLAAVETVHALRLAGLTADALAFARETAVGLLTAGTKP